MSQSRKQTQPTLATTVDAFDHWRLSGVSRRSTPEHLQQQAANLVGSQPKSVICRSLGISNTALKQWHARWPANEVASDFIALPTQAQEQEHFSDNDRNDDQSEQHQLDITLPNGVALSTNVSLSQLMDLIQAASAADTSASEHGL